VADRALPVVDDTLPAQRARPGAARADPAGVPPLRRWQALTLAPAFLVLVDVLAIGAGFVLAYVVRFVLEIPAASEIHSARAYAGLMAVATPVTLVAFLAYGLYERRHLISAVDQWFRLATAVLVGLVITVAVSSFVVRGWPDYSRLLLGYLWVGCTGMAGAGRFAWVRWRDALARRGVAVRTVLVVGTGPAAERVAHHFQQLPHLGYRVIGFLDGGLPAPVQASSVPALGADDGSEAVRPAPAPAAGEPAFPAPPVVGRLQDFDAVLAALRPNEIILADPTLTNQEMLDIVNRCEGIPVAIRIFPDVFQMLVSEAALVNLRGLPLVGIHAVELEAWQRTVKRLFDVAFSATLLVLASPLMLLIALLVKLDSPGPVFYTQERVGQDGKRFHVIKFRSMIHEAEAVTGRFWTVREDPRRTRLGRWLRRLSLDELPQFINVLVGDMSVVGPRPERPMFVAQFSEAMPGYLRRLREKAGITGWAQINGLRGDSSIEERTKYDLYYVDNWSLWLDLKIIIRTIPLLFRDQNAY
jgi:Undecaprenyl-phosphate glucose phosphotransferase